MCWVHLWAMVPFEDVLSACSRFPHNTLEKNQTIQTLTEANGLCDLLVSTDQQQQSIKAGITKAVLNAT